jgi:hypothetical protein
MARKYSKSQTPSLGENQEWRPTSGPSPYREHISGGVSHPPERNVDAERATRWNDPNANARRISRGAKPAKRKPR